MFAASSIPSLRSTPAVRGCSGKKTGSSRRASPADDPAEPLRPDVRLAMDRRDDVRPRLVRRRDAPARDRREAKGGVRHHVTDDERTSPVLLPRRASRPTARRDRAGASRAGRPRSASAPPASTGRRCGGPPRRARSGRRPAPQPGRRRGSSWCRRGPARRPAAPTRSPRGWARSASRRPRCADPAGARARGGRAPRRRPRDSSSSQCCPVWTTTSSIPASRSAAESGADLTNCGRFPTTVRTRIGGQRSCRTRVSCPSLAGDASRPPGRAGVRRPRLRVPRPHACRSSSALRTQRTARSRRSRSRPGPCAGCGRSRTPSAGSASARLDLETTPRPLYVGRRWVHDDDDDELLVVNWQAPAARPFYVATPEKPLDVTSAPPLPHRGPAAARPERREARRVGLRGGRRLPPRRARAEPRAAHARHRRVDPGRPVQAHHPRARPAAGRPGRARHGQDGGRPPSRLVPPLHAPRAAQARARRRPEPDVHGVRLPRPADARGRERRAARDRRARRRGRGNGRRRVRRSSV